MRYFIEIQYNGMKFSGWQVQPNAITVQSVIQEKLSLYLRENIEIVGSGRTDAGVHAISQWAHFDYSSSINPDFLQRINRMLPESIAIRSLAQPILPELHARFDAVQRSYVYKIARKKNPFLHGQSWLNTWNLDPERMQIAAGLLLNHTDFSCFEKKGGDNFTSICHIFHSFWIFTPEVWEFHISANRFLRGMVRAIVGTLIECGKHTLSLEAWQSILLSQDRTKAAQNAPPEGLFLSEVRYPENSFIILQQ